MLHILPEPVQSPISLHPLQQKRADSLRNLIKTTLFAHTPEYYRPVCLPSPMPIGLCRIIRFEQSQACSFKSNKVSSKLYVQRNIRQIKQKERAQGLNRDVKNYFLSESIPHKNKKKTESGKSSIDCRLRSNNITIQRACNL
jgi:hypothetical protein